MSGSFTLDVSFAAAPGITMLFGPSGAGKTTLLDCIAGLVRPDSGRIAIGDLAFFDSDLGVNLAVRQRRMAYVFQNLALFPHLTVQQNVQYGLAGMPAGERHHRVDTVLESFHIAGLRRRRPREISGGEAQRTALARALVTEPRALLLDEPLSALDAAVKSAIVHDLRGWNDSHRIPVLYVTHSRDELFALGERVIALEDGKVLAQGDPHQVLAAPRHETMAQMAGCENIFDATVTALHEELGTMTCRLGAGAAHLEVPLGRASTGDTVRIGVRAGDILLAAAPPQALSARNVLAGKILSLQRRDVTVVARVDCGLEMEVHLTPAAQHSLSLAPGTPVWLVIKTYSCHLLR